MKKIFSILAVLMWLALPVWAQENKRPRFNPEEFKAKMETYITQKAGLSQAEVEKVFPIFHEMKSKQFEVQKQVQKLKRDNRFESESDYQDALTKMGELSIEGAKIETAYYKKISKAVSAKKAYRIKMADDAFHREILQHINNTGKDRQPNKRKP